MCGRFKLESSPADVKAAFGLDALEAFPPRPNIAPTQPILLVIDSPFRERPGRRAMLARWGLIPSFAKDPREAPLLFNARAETAAERPSFRAAFRHRRCLIPASGFYEWRKRGRERSQPFLVAPRAGGVLALAGLMETFMAADGSEIDTATILTCAANEALAPIHERMPVIVPQADFARWLDCRETGPSAVSDILAPAPADLLEAVALAEAGTALSVPAKARPAGGPQQGFDF